MTRSIFLAALFGALVPAAASAQAQAPAEPGAAPRQAKPRQVARKGAGAGDLPPTLAARQDGPSTPAAKTPAAAGPSKPAAPKQVAPGQSLKLTPYFALYEALGKPDGWRINGSIRPRYEALGGQFRPAPAPATNDLLSLQFTLFAEYDTGPVRIGGELIDARAYLQRRGSNSIATTEVNALELGQAYLGFDLEDSLGAGTVSTLTAGRFTQNVGSRRLIARNQFRNTINSFTGVAYDWQNAERDRLRVFWTMPQYRLPDDRAGILSNSIEFDREGLDAQLFGAIFTKSNVLGGILEGYGFGFVERDESRQLAGIQTRNRKLFTPGFRFYRPPTPGQFDHEFEAIGQIGYARNTTAINDQTDVPVEAYFFHAEGGYTFDTPWEPRLSFQYDQASGDSRKTTTYTRFDTLFGARRWEYGPTSLYGAVQRANLVSPGVRVEIAPDPTWDAFFDYRALFLQNSSDTFAATGVRDRTSQTGNFAGHQFEGRLRYWLVPRSVVMDLGSVYLLKGDVLETAPNAPRTGDTIYGYLSTSIFF